MRVILLYFFLFVLSPFHYSQSSNNPLHPIIYGIDLNASWYDLTNYSIFTYSQTDKLPESQHFVISDFTYSHTKIESVFKNLMFDELLLGFPKGKSSELKLLKPDLLLCRKNYESDIAFTEGSKDFRIVLEGLMMRVFGQGELAFFDENVYTYKWENSLYQAVISSVKEDNQVFFMYLKKRDN